MSHVVRRTVSMPPELNEYVEKLEQRAEGTEFRFVFSHFVCELIKDHRARETKPSES